MLVQLSLLSSYLRVLDRNSGAASAQPHQHNSVLPEPLRVLMEYQQLHSVEAMERQPEHRKYAIGFYSCPLQAGNRLHSFFNSLLWAILTNRTLLWQYIDPNACRHHQVPHPFCQVPNTKEECDRVLTRASWIPSYDEWATPLGLDNQEPVLLSHWTTHPKDVGKHAWIGGDEKYAGIDENEHSPEVIFPPMVGKKTWIKKRENREYLLHTYSARKTSDRLVEEGVEFLYGMLFRHTFQINDEIVNNSTDASTPFSIALHSRHSNDSKDGFNIEHEIQCLKLMLKNATTLPCQVYLLSDRPQTLIRLRKWLHENYPNCTAHVADHSVDRSWRAEHGPWAGQGYFQDLALAIRARDGFIGTVRSNTGGYRSSSDLVLELIEYDRRMEAYRDGIQRIEPLPQCKL